MGMTEQQLRARVIAGLEWMAESHIGVEKRIADEALALLKAQEPRLITYDELKAIDRTDSTVYVERRTKTFYNEVAFVAIEKVYGDTITFNGQKSIFGHSKKDYGKTWRCWTSRPSKEEMEATPWN